MDILNDMRIGVSSGLKYADKEALINIANNADISSSVINTNLANILGSPTLPGDTWVSMIANIYNQKTTLANNLKARGKSAEATMSLKQLADLTTKDANCIASKIIPGAIIDGVTGAPFNLNAGDVTLYSHSPIFSNATTSYVKKKEVQIDTSGIVRVSFELLGGPSSAIGYARIYLNGVAVGTERSNGSPTEYALFTEDININANDLIQIWLKSSANSMNINCKNLKIATNIKYPLVTVNL